MPNIEKINHQLEQGVKVRGMSPREIPQEVSQEDKTLLNGRQNGEPEQMRKKVKNEIPTVGYGRIF